MEELQDNTINFASILNSISFTIPDTKEEIVKEGGYEFVSWGNSYNNTKTISPKLYQEMSSQTPTLSSIISRRQDYLMGRGITFKDGLEIDKNLIFKLFKDIQTYGGFAVQIGWNGQKYVMEYIKISNLRTNEDYTKFYHRRDWSKNGNITLFDAFDVTQHSRKAQIYYYKEPNDGIYPTPLYASVLTSCNTQLRILDFNNNSVSNAFGMGVYLTIPSTNPNKNEEATKLARKLNIRHTGNKVANQFEVFPYPADATNKPEIKRLNSDRGYMEQYDTISKTTKAEIYQAMKAIPTLFGDITQSTGFNTQEFIEAYEQENTYINRLQGVIVDFIDGVYGEESIVFQPYYNNETANYNAEQIVSIISNPNLTSAQKKAVLKLSLKLSDEDIDSLQIIDNNTITNEDTI